MRELVRTNDVVRLHYLRALLDDAGVASFVFDAHMSVTEGSIGVLPRRLMVADGDEARARRVLADAGERPEEDGGAG